jgi:hypothetical protein
VIITEALIEEFEQGAWIADLKSLEKFDGTFTLPDGSTWTGTEVSSRQEGEHYFTRVIGGANGLTKKLDDRFYDGSVSVQAAVQQICQLVGETFGEAKKAAQLTTFERLGGPAYSALDAIADAFTLKWWIGRDGKLSMLDDRPSAAAADGQRVRSDVDSVDLVDPIGVQLGGTYDDKPLRHLRWSFTPERFAVTAYFLPFLFRAPVERRYDALYDAKVDRDNGDGTIDVIATGRFGVKKVKLLIGVPHAKAKLDGGELVTLGFFGGDPQKPYALAVAQDTSATKQVARKGDSVKVTITPDDIVSLGLANGGGSVAASSSVDVTGEITSGSDRLKVGD